MNDDRLILSPADFDRLLLEAPGGPIAAALIRMTDALPDDAECLCCDRDKAAK